MLLSLFHRIARASPRFRAAEQSRDVFKTLLFEFERRTGAQVFGRSRTVEDDQLVAREFARARSELSLIYVDRPFDVILLVLRLGAYVHHNGRTFFNRIAQVGRRHALDAVARLCLSYGLRAVCVRSPVLIVAAARSEHKDSENQSG
jgi:hypothetical protein